MKKTIFFLLVGVMMTSFLAGCSQTIPQTQSIKTVKIGVIAPLSGPAANYGEDAVNTYGYIVDTFNASQSKLKIELVIEDGKCDGKSASSAAQKLINIDKVQVIVGGFCSAETIAAGKIAQPNKVVMISSVSSSPEVAKIGDYIFRFYNDTYTTKKLSDYMTSQGAKKVFVLAENIDTCIDYLNGIKAHFSGDVEQETYQKEEKDFLMIAKQIKSKLGASDFLVVLPGSDTSTIGIIESLDKEGILKSMKGRIAFNELITSSQSYAILGQKMDGIKTTQLVNLGYLPTSAKDIVGQLQKKFTISADPTRVVLGAEAMSLAIDAIVNAGNDGQAIKNYFTHFNENDLRNGYFGNYYFTPERDAHGLDFLVYEVKDGKLVNGK